MNKIIKIISIFFFFISIISCDSDILMNNGEIIKPSKKDDGKGDNNSTVVFSKEAPTGINATKSFFDDRIIVRWNPVEGADYYTLEKLVQQTEEAKTADGWEKINESIFVNSYEDRKNLIPSEYYSYRVTAHSILQGSGETSVSATGTILASPVSLSATQGTDTESITITWDQMPNVDSYKLYKGDNSSVTGLPGEFVTDINSSEAADKNIYIYNVEGKEKGKVLYFALRAVGQTGNIASISSSRSGYSKVVGAPVVPTVDVDKGVKTDVINIRFLCAGDDESTKYTIKRFYLGSSEEIIFEGDSSSLVKDGDYFIFTDEDVQNNVEYTYSIIAENDIGMSPAGIDTGYLLSPFKSLSLVPVKSDEKLGYELKYTLPVGALDRDYQFMIKTETKGGSVENISKNCSEFVNEEWFFEVNPSPSRETEKDEIRKVSISVSNESESAKSVDTNSIADLPVPIESITASSNAKPIEGDIVNSKGVYPVHINWVNENNASVVRTITRKGSDGSVVLIGNVNSTEYSDTDTSPLVIYDYYIDTSDALGRTIGGDIKHATNSYGAIDFVTYKNIFESVSLKPWDYQSYIPKEYKSYWKRSQIGIMVGYGNASDLSTQMKALGNANDSDHFGGGTIRYNASMEGVGGQIYFYYNNFGENEFFKTTGNYEMHVNASGTGSAGSNTNGFNITGMYPGHIGIGNISVSGKNFVGRYTIEYKYSDGTDVKEVEV